MPTICEALGWCNDYREIRDTFSVLEELIVYHEGDKKTAKSYLVIFSSSAGENSKI